VKTNSFCVLLTLALSLACAAAPEDVPPTAPEAIGDELMRVEGTWAISTCARSHLYRQRREVQHQCFDANGQFAWENRGTLTADASAKLDAALAEADLSATEPVDYAGSCDAPDARGTITMWVGEQAVSFAPFCLFEGIVVLYEQVQAIRLELLDCDELLFEQLESVAPECRSY
jgi:hypothetical protein